MQTVGRKQVDNKIISSTQIAGGYEFHIEEEVTKMVGRKQVKN